MRLAQGQKIAAPEQQKVPAADLAGTFIRPYGRQELAAKASGSSRR
jgi:hypothetical protein